ncbi:MAG: haloacid dehalogenase-like hydrolase [Puniceicoccales bacterium]|jgi:hypothetical protein|nr:haloacid dehalogenase-like hydrolase [Puniceicoccales bacterium]
MNDSGNVIACIWDFDKTLIPGCMQAPLFREYAIDESAFWKVVNDLPLQMRRYGIRISETLAYLNCLLELVKMRRLPGLSKKKLAKYGQQLTFYPGIPEIFSELKKDVESDKQCQNNGITLEHYIVSSGNVETIRGSKIAPWVDDIFACEFLENEMGIESRRFLEQIAEKQIGFSNETAEEKSDEGEKIYENANQMIFSENGGATSEKEEREITQIAYVVDNTQKTRCLFEINKGSNKNMAIDVNTKIEDRNRRIPFKNMIYIADGPSDIPAFSLIRSQGGKAFAVYNPASDREFEQNDRMLAEGRIDAYGPADYRLEAPTAKWIRMHVQRIVQRILRERELLNDKFLKKSPEHFH